MLFLHTRVQKHWVYNNTKYLFYCRIEFILYKVHSESQKLNFSSSYFMGFCHIDFVILSMSHSKSDKLWHLHNSPDFTMVFFFIYLCYKILSLFHPTRSTLSSSSKGAVTILIWSQLYNEHWHCLLITVAEKGERQSCFFLTRIIQITRKKINRVGEGRKAVEKLILHITEYPSGLVESKDNGWKLFLSREDNLSFFKKSLWIFPFRTDNNYFLITMAVLAQIFVLLNNFSFPKYVLEYIYILCTSVQLKFWKNHISFRDTMSKT